MRLTVNPAISAWCLCRPGEELSVGTVPCRVCSDAILVLGSPVGHDNAAMERLALGVVDQLCPIPSSG